THNDFLKTQNELLTSQKHLDTIPATESDEVIMSSVKDLVPIPISLMDDDSFSINNINYVEASPLDSELVSSEVMEIVIPEVRGIDDDIPLTIKDENLRKKLLNVGVTLKCSVSQADVEDFSRGVVFFVYLGAEVTSEDESKCDMPIQDQSSSVFTTFSNPLFKNNDDLTSSDDKSLFEEDVPIEESKVYSNPLFNDDEINSDELESHVESLSNHDDLIESEEIDIVTETDDVLPPSVENDDDSEEGIHFLEELLSDNSIPLTDNESSDSDHQDDPSFP
nr:hypothetical protein [Tanacetum cinerariifolium]